MPSYQLEGPKPARMYEVILPKKLGYFGKIQEVLESLFDAASISKVPYVQRLIKQSRKRDQEFDQAAWVRSLSEACRGYSIYEMDGRYLSPTGPVDERVLVIRFIFHNPANLGDSETDFLGVSLQVINYLVAQRFAEELDVEEEIWFLEYTHTQLAIWRRSDGPHW
jgi:hypothetical protein